MIKFFKHDFSASVLATGEYAPVVGGVDGDRTVEF